MLTRMACVIPLSSRADKPHRRTGTSIAMFALEGCVTQQPALQQEQQTHVAAGAGNDGRRFIYPLMLLVAIPALATCLSWLRPEPGRVGMPLQIGAAAVQTTFHYAGCLMLLTGATMHWRACCFIEDLSSCHRSLRLLQGAMQCRWFVSCLGCCNFWVSCAVLARRAAAHSRATCMRIWLLIAVI